MESNPYRRLRRLLNIGSWAALLLGFSLILPCVMYQVSNPDLTPMRVLVDKWPYYLEVLLCVGISYTLRYAATRIPT
jgi:hypothetical protein